MRARRRGVLIAIVTLVGLAGSATGSTLGATVRDRLPDLRGARLSDFHITLNNGHRLLRFTTIMLNLGQGPLEVRGHRDSTAVQSIPTVQRIQRSDGSWRLQDSDALLRFEVGDNHRHWHVWRQQAFSLMQRGGEQLTLVRGAKSGYCFFDTDPWRRILPNAPPNRVYTPDTCGGPSTLGPWMGLSVGWGDRYPWDFARQWIDITGVPDGWYRVCVRVDPQANLVESREDNNVTWQEVRLSDGASRFVLGEWSAWQERCR